jgi:DNA ligase-associated metallophosphoesterase
MTGHQFQLIGTPLVAMPSGALWIPDAKTLCVSDLHLGKSGRIARRAGKMLPPYETTDTLARLADDIALMQPTTVICLGDSFDDLDAATELTTSAAAAIAQMQAGRTWIWIEGNHDPGPVSLGGTHLAELFRADLTFRHIATDQVNEVSGHYHPKFGIMGMGPARACFIYDKNRLILPAYGTYTGGLNTTHPVLRDLFEPTAIAVLTGKKAIALPITKAPHQRRPVGTSY